MPYSIITLYFKTFVVVDYTNITIRSKPGFNDHKGFKNQTLQQSGSNLCGLSFVEIQRPQRLCPTALSPCALKPLWSLTQSPKP